MERLVRRLVNAGYAVVHVSPQAPPFFLFHGTWDQLVTIAQAEALRERLEDADVPVRLHRQSLRGHVGSFLLHGGAMRDAIAFLQQHLND